MHRLRLASVPPALDIADGAGKLKHRLMLVGVTGLHAVAAGHQQTKQDKYRGFPLVLTRASDTQVNPYPAAAK